MGVFTITRHFQIQTEIENQGVEVAKLASSSICLVGQLHVRPERHASARVLVLMQQRKEEEFVFMAIYRQEWCL